MKHPGYVLVAVLAGALFTWASWLAQPETPASRNLDFCFEDGRLAIGCIDAAKNAATERLDALLKE